ncbi:hypothetical protein [Clostridium grantii]|uniref:Uncharacterized protein n=1 Tax=Clostridium grantii DSM 8605 TaxID=1121316 RepID=A0A1M5RPC0_9CLOT|nr:hypothetical protein [Clostridium grantii]SHH27948.1 hypothetical protein SAMN02745207_00636 [Clostridium grantii DSM 8605]
MEKKRVIHASYERYIKDILSSEAKIARCLQELFCEGFVDDLKKIEPLDKRVNLTHSLVCAYACKEKSMADLINALNYGYSIKPPCKPHKENCNVSTENLLLLGLIAVIFICNYKVNNCCY